MPEIENLLIPNKEGKESPYRLEILVAGSVPTTFSLYYRRVEEKKNNQTIVRSTKTYAFCFNHPTGRMIYSSLHRGDFTNPQFRWSENREVQFEENMIPGDYYLKARGAVKKAYEFLIVKKKDALSWKERDRYDLFLTPLKKILDSS